MKNEVLHGCFIIITFSLALVNTDIRNFETIYEILFYVLIKSVRTLSVKVPVLV